MKLLSLLTALALLPTAVLAQSRILCGTPPLSGEAAAVEICRKFVQAQLRHAQADRDDDFIREYAQAFLRTKRQPDGLYDPAAPGVGVDPLWQRIEQAWPRGYFARRGSVQEPYCGYWFAILKSQGAHAPGGWREYMVGTHLSGGFALIAWPAKYGESGRRAFIVNQSGRILEKDLGPGTAKLAKKITSYDPDASWKPAANQ
jgi:hypothetical protein